MNEYECLEAITQFLAVLKVHDIRGVPVDTYTFAQVVMREDSDWAKQFPVYDGVMGHNCPMLQRGITLARAAGTVTIDNFSGRITSDMTKRRAKEVLKRPLSQQAETFVLAYVKALGVRVPHEEAR